MSDTIDGNGIQRPSKEAEQSNKALKKLKSAKPVGKTKADKIMKKIINKNQNT